MQGLELTIFLSGTREDLQDERTAIRTQIGPPLYQIEAFEDWGTQPHHPRDRCIRAVKENDVYLGLYGGHYGSNLPGEAVSITEWEFSMAQDLGKPILIYARRVERESRQQAFLARVSDFDTGHIRRPEFENPGQLVGWVGEDLIALMEELIEESEGEPPAARDPLIYVKCRLNLALLAREDGQWEQAVRHCQWVMSQGVWNETAYDLALCELQSLYKEGELWDDVIEMARARVELVGVLASDDWRHQSGHVDTHVTDGFQNSRLVELADLYVEWARVNAGTGDWQQAVDHLGDALEIYRELSRTPGEEAARRLLAETYEAWATSCEGMPGRAERVEASRAYRNAIKVYERMRDRTKLGVLWSRLARVQLRDGKAIGALQSLRRSLEYQEENGAPCAAVDEIVVNLQAVFEIQYQRRWHPAAVKTLLRQVEVLLWAGRYPQAISTAKNAVELCLEVDKSRLLLDS